MKRKGEKEKESCAVVVTSLPSVGGEVPPSEKGSKGEWGADHELGGFGEAGGVEEGE